MKREKRVDKRGKRMFVLREMAELLYADLLLKMARLYHESAKVLFRDTQVLIDKADEVLSNHFRRK